MSAEEIMVAGVVLAFVAAVVNLRVQARRQDRGHAGRDPPSTGDRRPSRRAPTNE